jgi:hypothetical protein
MKPRASLIFVFTILSALLILLFSTIPDPSSHQVSLKGTWVLSQVTKEGVVTPQAYDEADLYAIRYRGRLPELRGLEVSRYRDGTVVSFTDSQFITRESGKIVGKGAYTINYRTAPPTLMLYCVTFRYYIHEASSQITSSKGDVIEVGLIVEPRRFRMLLKGDEKTPQGDIVTFKRF